MNVTCGCLETKTFDTFYPFFSDNNPACFWQLATNSREISLCKYVCKLFAFRLSPDYIHNCQLCGARISDLFSHLACSFQFTHEIREKWWEVMIHDYELGLCELQFYHTLLGRSVTFALHGDAERSFRLHSFNFLKNAIAFYHTAHNHLI